MVLLNEFSELGYKDRSFSYSDVEKALKDYETKG